MMFNKQFKFEIDLETGMVIDNNVIDCFGGGKGGGTTTVPTPVYTPPPAAPSTEAAAQQDLAATPEEVRKREQKALKEGAKSLQIPITGDTGTTAVGTGTTTSTTNM